MAQLKIRTGVVFFFFYCYNVSPLLDSTVSTMWLLTPLESLLFLFYLLLVLLSSSLSDEATICICKNRRFRAELRSTFFLEISVEDLFMQEYYELSHLSR